MEYSDWVYLSYLVAIVGQITATHCGPTSLYFTVSKIGYTPGMDTKPQWTLQCTSYTTHHITALYKYKLHPTILKFRNTAFHLTCKVLHWTGKHTLEKSGRMRWTHVKAFSSPVYKLVPQLMHHEQLANGHRELLVKLVEYNTNFYLKVQTLINFLVTLRTRLWAKNFLEFWKEKQKLHPTNQVLKILVKSHHLSITQYILH